MWDWAGRAAGKVPHGQFDGLVCLVVGLKGAIAVARQHEHIATGVADQNAS
jgi:hypothetical protein